MKISLKDIQDKKDITRVKYTGNSLIVFGKNYNRVYKKTVDNNVYKYLDTKGFTNYLKPIITINNIDEFNYLENRVIDSNDKAIDLIYILAFLQNKTTSYEEMDLDRVKKDFEDINNQIDYLYEYYFTLQDVIERKVYYTSAEYVLMINISIVYEVLRFAKEAITKYYDIISNKKQIRKVFVHDKIDLNHFFDKDNKQIIGFKRIKKDLPVYDFIYFYKQHYQEVDMSSLFEIYQQKFEYTEEELLFLFANLLLVDKIVIKDNTYSDYETVQNFVEYLKTVKEFVLKQNKKYKENKERKFQK